MIINKHEFGHSGIEQIEQLLPRSSISKKIYHIPYTNGLNDDYIKTSKIFLEKYSDHTEIDGIILDFTAEAPEKERYLEICNLFIDKNYAIEKLFFLDGGIDTFKEIQHSLYPTWIGSWNTNNIISPKALEERKYLFLVLARLAKTYRVKFIIEMLERGLDGVSLISCGSAVEDQHLHMKQFFDKMVPEKFRYKFPLIIDNIVDRKVGTLDHNHLFEDALVNVVLETGFENTNVSDHCWDRKFYTEKTDKCFLLGQIPLFIAKKGYVHTLKNWGFDLFDDIIDHEYDNIEDPTIRINAVANECERLHNIGIKNIISNSTIYERLLYNQKQPQKVRAKIFEMTRINFLKWTEKVCIIHKNG
jgi:hypothetical protein